MNNSIWKYINYGLKVLLILGFVTVFLVENTALAGKGMEMRAPFFIFGSFSIFIIAKLKKWKNYPHMADAIFTIPFLLDTYGNIFGLFDSWRFYDDLIHMLNWVCFVFVFQIFNADKCKTKFTAFLLGAGFGAVLINFWELIEWFVSVDGVIGIDGLRLSYEDTVGDLLMSTMGGVIGSVLGLKFMPHNTRIL